jgi:Flp pilus assembly protein TadG
MIIRHRIKRCTPHVQKRIIFKIFSQTTKIFSVFEDHSGNAALEAALVLPLLLAFMSGIFNYGWYFFLTHNVQEITQDAARASIAGLDATERRQIIDSVIANETTPNGVMQTSLFTRSISETGQYLQLSVSYDSGRNLFPGMGLIPMPSRQITRLVVIRLPN